ncbi:uncharacterized protein LOC143229252 [Tachypleus tridentatus]|uniref:uncharacterized protein LOC143229252 n=1 Tax=Tachypleus tridentatus TaxID=6853 RepID=UPI003FD21F21
MNILKMRRKRVGFMLLIVTVVFLIIYSTQKSYREEDCTVPEGVQEKLHDLTKKVTDVLNILKLTNFLCYTSLWGALKYNGPMPWQSKLELCLLNEEVLKMEEAYFIKSFKQHGLVLSYDSGNGVYHVTNSGDESCEALLIVFEEDSVTHQIRRVGWKNRLLPPDSCEALHCFPPHLVSLPLPTHPFMNMKLPVPREEIEIQKYLFPNSWWKEVGPPLCKN